MDFKDYHEAIKASVLPQYPSYGDNIVYPALGCADEAGEVAGKVKKLWRDHGATTHGDMRAKGLDEKPLLKEIGDVLWYLDALADTLGSSLEECAKMNVVKLTGRNERGTALGSGDDR